jgi:hypothetical protein
MDDLQFQLLDECYFLTNTSEIKKSISISEDELKNLLLEIWIKGYIRVYEKPDGIEYSPDSDFDWNEVWFIISREGLKEHNAI